MAIQSPPFMFWAVASVGLVWNLMGCWSYITQLDPDAVERLPEVSRFIVENRPQWATAAFAVSVFGGTIGAVLMLLRRRSATGVLAFSVIGTGVMAYFTVRVLGVEPATLSALLMSLALFAFALVATQRGWLI
ncbi:MAG: hypothetical protein AAF092_12535 [Pseudomonadota bacterium]